MLFCPRSPMKCLSRILAVLGIAASVSCGGSKPAPPAAATLYRHLEGDPTHPRSDHLDRRVGRARRGADLPSARGHGRAAPAGPLPGVFLERRPRRPHVRVPPRPEVHVGDGAAGHLRRRALHDRARPRSEDRFADVARALRGPRRRRDARSVHRAGALLPAVRRADVRLLAADRLRGRVRGREGRGGDGSPARRQRALSTGIVGIERQAAPRAPGRPGQRRRALWSDRVPRHPGPGGEVPGGPARRAR